MFVFEFVTGGGFLAPGSPPLPASLAREGRAMLSAVVADLLAASPVEILWDHRLHPLDFDPSVVELHTVHNAAEWQSAFERRLVESTEALIIAPEFDRLLLNAVKRAEAMGVRLFSPDAKFVELTSSKHLTWLALTSAGVPTPTPTIRTPAEPRPADCVGDGDVSKNALDLLLGRDCIWKPIDGAGSLHVTRFPQGTTTEQLKPNGVLQPFLTGRPASVSALCGPKQVELLPPFWQRLNDDLAYQGGESILEPQLIQRAHALAARAIDALPRTRGYIGVDLVLGDAPDGHDDAVIEVNPRLTTSYVGLQNMCHENLAGAMVAIASGRPSTLTFRSGKIRFDADGTLDSRETE